MGVEIGWGRNSKSDHQLSQFELRTRWEVGEAAATFQRIFHVNLLSFVGHVEKVFSPPQSIGLLFEFGPGMRDEFLRLIDNRAFPPKSPLDSVRSEFVPKVLVPDNPGIGHRDAWWRQAASGAAIGASFREAGTQTSLHVAFNETEADVHVDRNGFVVTQDGYTHWDLSGLLRHLTVDLAGDKAPWVLVSLSLLDRRKRPIFQATLSPWLAVDLPSRENDRSAVKVGLIITGYY